MQVKNVRKIYGDVLWNEIYIRIVTNVDIQENAQPSR